MTSEQALSRMAALCSRSEHCESEIRIKLQRAAVPEDEIDNIVDSLYDGGYLDAARYCRAYARDQLRFAHWGRVKIAAALRQKRLPASDIDAGIRELSDEEYQTALAALLRARARTLPSDATPQQRQQTLLRYAASHGFTLDETLKAIEFYFQK